MFPTALRRLASTGAPPIAPKLRNATRKPLTGIYANSPYKPKKVWPPDFAKLSQKDQFRFERRYKRRVKLATARPRWDKYVKLAQLGSVTFVLVYSVLFMDWNTEKQPFEGIRSTFWGTFGAFSPEQRHERQRSHLPTAADQK
ncbi:hypothetical protein HD806DRAFT_349944 [Xylariaceae sp. AK1471]|nr:hypothetical protein HD806DRAFT_458454 [Xylariaceae sp. AK1471]KAI3328094.1 hypothetical protein HD806DRAFT_349944 [Xylariaceae sp. AK1471]